MVNLKKSKHSEDSVEFSLSDQFLDQVKNNFDVQDVLNILIRLVVVAIAPIVLHIYNIYYIKKLNVQKNQVAQELNEKKNEIQELNKKITSFDGLKEKAKVFEDKIAILEKLARDRLKIIKILDGIQTGMGLIEEKKGNSGHFIVFKNVSIQDLKITIHGLTNDEESIKDFLITLEEENLYSDIHLESVRSEGNKSIKTFHVSGVILETI